MVTEFQQRVYDTVSMIPRGKVSSYGAVASQINCGSARAVGQALKRNPFAPRVPCHRVIASDLRIGGFMGGRARRELARKRALLEREGVMFGEDGRLKDRTCFFRFAPE